MEALSAGFKGRQREVIIGEAPEDRHPFVIWGQEWLALRIIPKAYRSGRPFWHIDNGFWNPGRGGTIGYYRFTYRSMTPVLLPDGRDPEGVTLKPWSNIGKTVLLAMPGLHFGRALGIDVGAWCAQADSLVRSRTNRPVRVRSRESNRPLAEDLTDAWAVVTHSSNVAVDSVIAGVPVFVAPTSPAAPVGRTDMCIEEPVRPRREQWLRSLAAQHFTVDEMQDGIAQQWMVRIARQVDQGN